MNPSSPSSRKYSKKKIKNSRQHRRRRQPQKGPSFKLRLRPCVPRNCFRLLIIAIVLHYVMLIGVYYGFFVSKDSGSIQSSSHDMMLAGDVFWKRFVTKTTTNMNPLLHNNSDRHDHSASDSRISGNSRSKRSCPRFLWGIDTDRSEQDRRQLIRGTYLKRNNEQSVGEPPHICSLYDYEKWLLSTKTATTTSTSANISSSSSLENCQIVYVFVMIVNDPTIATSTLRVNNDHPSLLKFLSQVDGRQQIVEDDVVYLNQHYHPAEKASSSVSAEEDASRTTGKNVWWDFAVQVAIDENEKQRLDIDYITWIQPETLLIPKLFWDQVQHLPTGTTTKRNDHDDDPTTQRLVFGETTTSNHLSFSCNQCYYELDAKRLTGYIAFLSLALARKVVSTSSSSSNTNCKTYSSIALKDCIRANVVGEAEAAAEEIQKLQVIDLGHYYREESLERYKQSWDRYLSQVHTLRELNHTTTKYVTAKFGRYENQFAQELTTIKNLIISNGGFQPNQIEAHGKVFPNFITKDVRWERHLEFTSDMTVTDLGGGYWFWKPPLIEYHLNSIEDNEYMIYGDSDLWDHLVWLPELLEVMKDRNANLALYHNNFPENAWTKRDLYELLCDVRERYMPNDRTFQWHTGLLILKKTKGTIELMNAWTKLASNYHWISDEDSVIPNHPEVFKEHRRDQSILSLLLKCKYKEPQKEEFDHPSIRKLGWLKAYTFHIEPL